MVCGSNASQHHASQSLIIAPQWLGDAVMTEPLLRRLNARGERITVGALPWIAPIFRLMPQVAEVIEFPFAHGALHFKARRMLAKRIKGEFDKAYVLPGSIKSALLPFLAGIPNRIGYLGEARVGLLTHRLKNPKNKPPMVSFYSALSGENNFETDRPRLELPASEIEQTLKLTNLQRQNYVVFAPGAEYGPAKRWPAAYFEALATKLTVPLVLLGSAKEEALCDEIARPVNALQAGKCINLAGKTSLTQALGLIAASKSIISNDSGLMHVAAALNVPQVAIFGSSSPLHTPPLSNKAVIVWLKNNSDYQPPLSCAPCFERVCPLGHTRCLNDISPSQIFQAMSQLERH